MNRSLVIVEREVRRFVRKPILVAFMALAPLLQLVVMGFAFGGNIRDLRVAVVDQDHGVPALRLREYGNAVRANARTFRMLPYAEEGPALADLRAGRLDGVLIIPAGFSRKVQNRLNPGLGLVVNNADRFSSSTLEGAFDDLLRAYGPPTPAAKGTPKLSVVEAYPYVPYVQYLLPGIIVMAIFLMVMMGGAMSFIDDRVLGLQEGYFVTPITKGEMITGFVVAGVLKGICSGLFLTLVGASIAGIPRAFSPEVFLEMVLVSAMTSWALGGMLFLLVVRMTDPMLPRVISMLLNTLLFFPSGAVFPIQAFPRWLQWISAVDPFTYAVHAMRGLLIQGIPLASLGLDLFVLGAIGLVAVAATAKIFNRTL